MSLMSKDAGIFSTDLVDVLDIFVKVPVSNILPIFKLSYFCPSNWLVEF